MTRWLHDRIERFLGRMFQTPDPVVCYLVGWANGMMFGACFVLGVFLVVMAQ